MRHLSTMVAGLVLFACSASGQQKGMAFLDLDSIRGDADFPGFEHQIVVLGFSYEGTSPASASQIPEHSDMITLFKGFDVSSPKLLATFLKGSHLQKATLTLLEPGSCEDVARPHICHTADIVMQDIVVAAQHIQAPLDGSSPAEVLTLTFSVIKLTFYQRNSAGIITGTVSESYSFAQHRSN